MTYLVGLIDQHRPGYVRLMSTLGLVNACGLVGSIVRGRPVLVVVFLLTTIGSALAVYLTLSAERYHDEVARGRHPTSHAPPRRTS